MATKNQTSSSRRQEMMDRVNPPEVLDDTPIEIPADAKAPGRQIEELVQEQIRIQLAKKSKGEES